MVKMVNFMRCIFSHNLKKKFKVPDKLSLVKPVNDLLNTRESQKSDNLSHSL